MSEEFKSAHPPGTACIKSEYLKLDHIRELNINFVANKDKRAVNKCSESSADEPHRKKLRGQNKHRPREKKVPKREKLCFSIGAEGFCAYGNNCCYSHDVDDYLSTKPMDISETCYLFETFGKCPYSFSCRFSSKHIADGKNIINDELWNQFKNKQLIFNVLGKDLQKSLRKHAYDFSRTKRILKAVEGRNILNVNKILKNNCSEGNLNFKVISNEKNIQHDDKLADIGKCTDDSPDIHKHEVVGNEDTELQPQKPISMVNTEDPLNVVTSLSACDSTKDKELVIVEGYEDLNKCINIENSVDVAESKSFDFESENSVGSVKAMKMDNVISGEGKESDICLRTSIGNSSSFSAIEEDIIKLRPSEIKKIDFRGKLYLAPLTTVGNLPFRRICKEFGVDITCGEMAMALSLLQGHQSEWALLKRHHTEDIFGIQLCGSHYDLMTKCSQLLTETISVDFIDINMGCPLELVYKKGAGCGLMNRLKKFDEIILGMSSVINVPLTVKMRSGVYSNEPIAHNVINRIHKWGDCVSLVTLHGRSKEQRYTKLADWSYIDHCAEIAHPVPLFGSGDVLSYEDYNMRLRETKISGVMIARGALIKPWIFTEIKEQRHWDISSSERMDILKSYVNYGLEHWGSDTEGVEKTRRFLLEWLSFLYRYIPVGLLERVPQHINERPPPYHGRDDLETLMASPSCSDWVKISEMLLGPVPENFIFLPKHKANAYQ